MPHSPQRRRQRSSAQPAFVWSVIVLGAFVLGFLTARQSLGGATGAVVTLASAAIAFVILSCAAGRIAAAVRNVFSLHSAHTNLGKFMRTNETFRAARRGISRPAH